MEQSFKTLNATETASWDLAKKETNGLKWKRKAAKRQLLTILVVIFFFIQRLPLLFNFQLNNCTFILGVLVKFTRI
jgi:hypothetical protein